MPRPGATSFDTSSKDPNMIRSRIFVGGLNTHTVSRDDVIELFSSFGTILGVTLFKGYAFVQYSCPSDAILAVTALNGYPWHGSTLEVKSVANDQKQSPAMKGNTNGTVGKRAAQSDSAGNAKKGRPQNNNVPEVSERREYSDLFICGVCKLTTTNLELFVKHRKMKCDKKMAGKIEDEPATYACRSCTASFITCWELIQHLGISHNLSVYRDADAALAIKPEMQ